MFRPMFTALATSTYFVGCDSPSDMAGSSKNSLIIDKSENAERRESFWLGHSIANWAGLVTGMDKIVEEGPYGEFYSSDD